LELRLKVVPRDASEDGSCGNGTFRFSGAVLASAVTVTQVSPRQRVKIILITHLGYNGTQLSANPREDELILILDKSGSPSVLSHITVRLKHALCNQQVRGEMSECACGFFWHFLGSFWYTKESPNAGVNINGSVPSQFLHFPVRSNKPAMKLKEQKSADSRKKAKLVSAGGYLRGK